MELLGAIKGYLISHGSLHRAATLRHQEQRAGGALIVSTHSLLLNSAVSLDSSTQVHERAITHILFILPAQNSIQAGSPQLLGKTIMYGFAHI